MSKLTEEQKLYVDLKRTAVTTSQGLKDIFYKVPKIFWIGELYKDMSLEAKIAYGILEDRKSVSIKNKWYDNEGKIYFIYRIEDLQKELAVSKATAVKIKKELLSYGLLEQKKSEPNKPARLYLYNPVSTDKDEKKYVLRYTTGEEKTEEKGTEPPSKITDLDKFTNSKQETNKVENGGLNFKLPDNHKENGGLNFKLPVNHKENGGLNFKLPVNHKENEGLNFKLPEVQNLNPSNTNVSNINNYISYDSYDSELKFDKRFLNYKKQGIPSEITNILTIGLNDYKSIHDRMGLLFKAKSSVLKEARSQGWKGSIIFEEFEEGDWEQLYQVLHTCFCKIKQREVNKVENYLFQSLKNYFTEYAQNYFNRGILYGN